MELAIVTIQGDKRPVTVYDLTDGTRNVRRRGTTRLEPTDQPGIGVLKGTWKIHAQTATELPVLIQAFTEKVTQPGRFEHLERKVPPATVATYYPRVGPGLVQVTSTAYHHALYRTATLEVEIPVEIPGRRLCMDVLDDFQVDSLAVGTGGDYTFDAGSETLVCSGGQLVPTSTALKQLYHSVRGHYYEDVEVTVKVTLGASDASSCGVILKRLAAGDFLVARMDNNGENWAIGKMEGGVETLYAAPAYDFLASTTYWLRGRIEGNVLTGEVFTSEPGPMSTPAIAPSHTLAGADAGQYGATVVGNAGLRVTPAGTDERYDDLAIRAYTYRNQTLPKKISLGWISGSAPALADFDITPSGGTDPPIWGLLGWTRKPSTPLSGAVAPFGIIEAGTAGDLSGWSATTHADAHASSILNDTGPDEADTYTASWTIDPSTLDPDLLKDEEVLLEVWARVGIDSQLVTPSLVLSAGPHAGANFGARRYSREHGTTGLLLSVPSADSWKPVRLGTLAIPTGDPVKWKVWLDATLGAGSAGGLWAIDYLWLAIANRRVRSPIGLVYDSAFPAFVKGTGETTKRITSEGEGLISSPPNPFFPDVGLTGPRIELPVGSVDVLAKLSSLVPNHASDSATVEQGSHAATVHVRVIPRVAE